MFEAATAGTEVIMTIAGVAHSALPTTVRRDSPSGVGDGSADVRVSVINGSFSRGHA